MSDIDIICLAVFDESFLCSFSHKSNWQNDHKATTRVCVCVCVNVHDLDVCHPPSPPETIDPEQLLAEVSCWVNWSFLTSCFYCERYEQRQWIWFSPKRSNKVFHLRVHSTYSCPVWLDVAFNNIYKQQQQMWLLQCPSMHRVLSDRGQIFALNHYSENQYFSQYFMELQSMNYSLQSSSHNESFRWTPLMNLCETEGGTS